MVSIGSRVRSNPGRSIWHRSPDRGVLPSTGGNRILRHQLGGTADSGHLVMPKYDFSCPSCGTFERYAGYDDATIPCDCGGSARRHEVYRDQGVIFRGGGFTKSVVPPPHSPDVSTELGKELKKKGWDYDRAMGEVRKNIVTDSEG